MEQQKVIRWGSWKRHRRAIITCALVVLASILLVLFLVRPTLADTTISWTGAVSTDWNDAENWSEDRVPDETDAVEVSAGTNQPTLDMSDGSVTLAQLLIAGSQVLTVSNGSSTNQLLITGDMELQATGQLTHEENDATIDVHQLHIAVDGNVAIASGAQIDVTAKGYAGVNGDLPGSPGNGDGYPSENFVVGGSYGGEGGLWSSSNVTERGETYGSITEPADLGSGGRTRPATPISAAGAGGGVVRLTVGGALQTDGVIAANGQTVANTNYFVGGSGGSVWIDAATISGAGTISTDGGGISGGTTTSSRIAGGGGRVAAYADMSGFTGSTHAYGGAQTGNNPVVAAMGASGTVYQAEPDGSDAVFTVNNSLNSVGTAARTPVQEELDVDTIAVQNKARLEFEHPTATTNHLVVEEATAVDSATIIVAADTTLTVAESVSLQNASMILDGTLTGDAAIVMEQATVTTGMMEYAPNITAESLTVGVGASITHVENPANTQAARLWLDITEDVTVEAGGSIDVDNKGYAGVTGVGPGGPGSGTATSGAYSIGGAYGGEAGWSETANTTRGVPYGSVEQPTDLGSGGRGSVNSQPGGGAIRVQAGGSVTNNGLISANGGSAPATTNHASGSGGSIFVEANELVGSGVVRANGGGPNSTTTTRAAGSGGRIALRTTEASDSFTNEVTAYGGAQSTITMSVAAAGTILQDFADESTLMIDNDGRTGAAVTARTLLLSDAEYGELQIENGAMYNLSGGSLTVSRLNSSDAGANTLLTVPTSATLTVEESASLADIDIDLYGAWRGAGDVSFEDGSLMTTYGKRDDEAQLMAGGVTVQDGAVVTHAANAASSYDNALWMASSGDITVMEGGAIQADGRGYAGVTGNGAGGPGSGTAVSGSYSIGGAYGGHAGFNAPANANRGVPYGDVKAPYEPGSGGRGSAGNSAAGGVVRLDAGGVVSNNGVISADGLASANTAQHASGSGGSVWIDAGAFAGDGSIRANGGATTNATAATRNSGSGGRIALTSGEERFDGVIAAYGGQHNGAVAAAPAMGAAGTIYEQVGEESDGILTVKNPESLSNNVTPQQYALTLDELHVQEEGKYTIEDSVTLGTLAGDETGELVLVDGETLTLADMATTGALQIQYNGPVVPSGDSFAFSQSEWRGSGSFDFVDKDITIGNGANIDFNHSPTSPQLVRDLTLNDGSFVSHSSNAATQENTLNFEATEITIENGAEINVVGKGYQPGSGPGAGGPTSSTTASHGSGGAGHGGVGGVGNSASGGAGGAAYGSPTEPIDLGSGGGLKAGNGTGYGGGAVKLSTTGLLTVDGVINANGGNATAHAQAGGSGGSIWLLGELVAGEGALSADGGTTEEPRNGGASAGGRIAVTQGTIPVIDSITPDSGSVAGGDTVTILGENFIESTTFTIGGTPVDEVTIVSETQAIVVIPTGVEIGAVDVVAINVGGGISGGISVDGSVSTVGPAEDGTVYPSADGGAVYMVEDGYTYVQYPQTVTSVTPTSGPAIGGQEVTVQGSNFVTPPSLSNEWANTGATLPSATYRAQTAVIGEFIYMISGSSSNIWRAPISEPTNWQNTGSSIPQSRYGAQMAVIGDFVYLFGGNRTQIHRAPITNPTNWSNTGSTFPGAVQNGQLAVVGEDIYFFGGSQNVIYRSTVANPLAWENTGASLPTQVQASQVVELDDRLYLFGGNGTNVIQSAPVDNPLAWTVEQETLPGNLGSSQLIVMGEDVYLLGGTSNVIYTAKVNEPTIWSTTGLTLPANRQMAQVAVLDDDIYLFGGYTGSAAVNTIFSAPIERLFMLGARTNVFNKPWSTNWQTSEVPLTALYFGDELATHVRVLNGSTITAQTPAGNGVVDVSVTGPQYSDPAVLSGVYTYTAGPTINGIVPNSSLLSGGDTAIITGENFTEGATVQFGDEFAENVIVLSDTEISVTIPPSVAPDMVSITLTAADGQFDVLSDAFTYELAEPTITAVDPAGGPTAGGTAVTVTGQNFVAEPEVAGEWQNTGATLPANRQHAQTAVVGEFVYLFGGDGANSIYRAPRSDPTAWQNTGATLPATVAGAQLVVANERIYLLGGTVNGSIGSQIFSASVSNPLSWREENRRLPATLRYSQLEIVDDTIYLFGGSRNVIYSAPVSDPVDWTNTGATLPLAMNRGSSIVANDRIYIFGGYRVGVSGIQSSIISAPVSDPTNWTNTGATLPANKADANIVAVGDSIYLIGGTSTRLFQADVSDPTTWTDIGTVPNAQRYAELVLVGNTIYRYGGNNTNVIFSQAVQGNRCNMYNKPWLTSWPTSNLCPTDDDYLVHFGDTQATDIDFIDSQNMIATAPPHAVGPVDVSIRDAGGNVRAALEDGYTYYANPEITSVVPDTAIADSADTVEVFGAAFLPGARVFFDGIEATEVTYVDDTQLQVVLPIMPYASKVTVTVENVDGQVGRLVDGFEFTFAAPTIESIVPDSGPATGDTDVTITGTNFSEAPFQQVSNGQYHSCGIIAGEAYCWGQNGSGQLGDGTTTASSTPVKVTQQPDILEGKTVSKIVAGGLSTCAIAGGEVYCWGYNNRGQLGDNTLVNRNVPVKVTQQPDMLAGKIVTDISVGYLYSCAVADGEAYCWGYNFYSQLGNGLTDNSSVPIKVTQDAGLLQGKTVTSISAGYSTACVVASGEVYCWGRNNRGQIGDGTTTTRRVPVKIVQESGILQGKTVTDIAAGSYSACAIADGEAYCWGYNNYGQLGIGSTAQQTTPVKVTQAPNALEDKTIYAITVGQYSTCAIAEANAYCWGYNAYGQLGDSTTATRNIPTAVTKFGSVSSISAGTHTTCAVASGGSYCWGRNNFGQIGNGATSNESTPTRTDSPLLPPEVFFDESAATDVVRVDATTVTAKTPEHTVGTVDVGMTLGDGQSATLENSFTYIGPPEVTSVTPDNGFLSGGDAVTITGAGFTEGATVLFGQTPAEDVVVVDENTITVTVPPSTIEWTVPVSVTNVDEQTGTLEDAYTYGYADPVITAIDPATGPSTGNTPVTITGQSFAPPATTTNQWTRAPSNLPATLAGSQVAVIDEYVYLFGGTRNVIYRAPVADPTNWENTGATLPASTSYSQLIRIGDMLYLFGNATIYQADVSDPLAWTPAGSLPNTTRYSQVAVIEEYIYLFGGQSRSTIYRAPVADPTNWENTDRTLPNTLNYSNIVVIDEYVYLFGGTRNVIYRAPVSDPLNWTDTGRTLPVNPNRAQLAVIGENIYLIGGATGQAVQQASIHDPLEWQNLGNMLPSRVYGSQLAIIGETMYLFGGLLGNSNTNAIHSAPVSGQQRNAGNRDWTTTWQPSATDSSTYAVDLGDARATDVTYVNSTTLTAVTAPHDAGEVNVDLTAPNGGNSVLDNGFMYTGPPEILSVTPDSGSAAGGDTVTVTGNDFMDGAVVTFGNEEASDVTFVDSNTLIVTVPTAPRSGTVTVTVTNPDTQSDTLQTGYTYTATDAIIESITLDAGPVSGGNEVTITGQYFDAKLMREVTVTNPSANELIDYRVQIVFDSAALIAAGKMRADGGDLRVSDASGVPLYYDLNEATLDSEATEVWVRVPTLSPGDNELLLSYGNSSLTSESAALPTRAVHANDLTAQTITTHDTLLWPYRMTNQNDCSPVWTAGGAQITSANIVMETQASHDFGSLRYETGTQIYRSSGNRNVQQSITPSAQGLQTCLQTNGSIQRGFGVNVPTVQAVGALGSSISDAEESNISIQFGDNDAQILSASDTELVVSVPASDTIEQVDVILQNQLALSPTVAADAYTYLPEAYAFTNEPFVVRASEPGMFTLEAQDTEGNPVTVATDIVLQLTSTSDGGEWSMGDDPDGDWSITEVVIPAGSSSIDFYYRDSNKGGPIITATDPIDVTAEQQVAIGAQYNLQIVGLGDPVQASIPNTITIQALDYTGEPQPGYTGTISFSSGDQAAIMPADYTFQTSDAGNATFINGLTFRTPGEWCLTVEDTEDVDISGEQCVTVLDPPAGTPAELRVITERQTIPADTSSTPITIQTWDAGDPDEGVDPAPAPVAEDTTLYVYTNSATGEYSADGTNWSSDEPFEVTMLQGTTTVNVYYRDSTQGTQLMTFRDDEGTGEDFGWRNAEQEIDISAGQPTALQLLHDATAGVGEWVPVTVSLVDAEGELFSANRNVPLLLTSDGGEWSTTNTADSGGEELEARMPIGSTSVVVYFRSTAVGEYSMTVAEDLADPALSGDDSSIEITAGEPIVVRFIPPASTELEVSTGGTYMLQFEDIYGNIAPVLEDTELPLATTSEGGEFTPAPPLQVNAGESMVPVQYTDSVVGETTLTASFGEETDDLELTIIPGVYANLSIEEAPEALVAGEIGAISINVVDQYGNATTYDEAITVDLSSLIGGNFSLSDTDWSDTTTVEIPADTWGVYAYYQSFIAGEETITATDQANDAEAEHTLTVEAAEPTNAVFISPEQTVIREATSDDIVIALQDIYGNMALAPEEIEFNLTTTSTTGEFLQNDTWMEETEVLFAAGEGIFTTAYRDTTAGEYELQIDGTEQQVIAIIEAPIATFAFDAPAEVQAGEIAELTLRALDENGEPTNATVNELIDLLSALGGEFSLSDTDWQPVTAITLPEGESELVLYYRSEIAGNDEWTASNDTITGQHELTVTPGEAVEARFITPERTVARGEESEAITIEIYDQFGNIAIADDDTSVEVQTTSDTGELSADGAGWFTTLEVAFTPGLSQMDVFYQDNVAGEYELSLYVGDTVPTDEQTITVTPDNISQFTLEAAEETVVAGEVTQLTLSGANSDGEATPALTDMLIQLTATLNGEFSLSDTDWQPVTSITLPEGEEEITFFYRPTTTGEDTLTATHDTISLQTQIEVVAGEPTEVVFLTNPQYAVADDSSEDIVIQLRDVYGNEATGLTGTDITVTSSSSTGQFSLDGETWQNSVVLPMGEQTQGLFFYTDSTPGEYTISAASSGLTTGTQPITILEEALPEPTSLRITAPDTVSAGNSTSLTIGTYDDEENPTPVPRNTSISLANTFGEFSLSETNWQPITDVTLLQGQQEVTLYYRATEVGVNTMSATGVGTGDTHEITVTAGDPYEFAFADAPEEAVVGEASTVFTLQLLDAFGNVVTPSADQTVYLHSNSDTGEFSLDGTTWTADSVMILEDTTVATFYYRDVTLGTATITISETSNLADPTRTINDASTDIDIVGQPIENIVFTTPERTIIAGERSDEITIEAQTAAGEPAIVGEDTVVALSGTSDVTFYTEATGGDAVTTVTIPAGSSSATVYARATLAGTTTLGTAIGGISATQDLTVTPAAAHSLHFTTPEQTVPRGAPSEQIMLIVRDEFANDTVVADDTEIELSSTLSGSEFSLDVDTWESITNFTLASGQGEAYFYFRGDTVGVGEIAATASGLQNAQQSIEVVANPAAQLRVVTSPQTIAAGEESAPIVVQLQDIYGNAIEAADDVTITLSSSSESGGFTPISITITAGETEASFTYSDITLGVHVLTITDESELLDGTTHDITIEAGEPTQLVWEPDTSSIATNERGVFTLELHNNYDITAPRDVDTIIALTSTQTNGAFYADESGDEAITEITIPAGETSITVYYEQSTTGIAELTAASPDLAAGTAEVTVYGGEVAELRFTSAEQTLEAGQTSQQITVETYDVDGNVISVEGELWVALTSSSSSGEFAADAAFTQPITEVSIAEGESQASFYYRDVTVGEHELTAEADEDLTATQPVTVEYGAPASIHFAETTYSLERGGTTGAIEFTLQNAHGVAVPASGDTAITLTTSAATGEFATSLASPWQDELEAVIADGQFSGVVYYRDITLGTATITASGDALTQDTASIEVVAGDIAQLAYTTLEQSVVATYSSDEITVQAQNAYGYPTTSTTDETITLSSNSGAGEFALSNSGPWNATQITLPAGESEFTYYYRDTTTGTHEMTAQLGSITGQQNITITDQQAGSFTVSGIPSPTVVGAVHDVTVCVLDQFGNPFTGYEGEISFSSSDDEATLPNAYTFTSSDAGCHTFTGEVAFATVGTQEVIVTDGTATGGQTDIVVDDAPAEPVDRLVITTPPAPLTLMANQVSPSVTVQAQDSNGQPTTAGVEVTVTTSSSAGQLAETASGPWSNSLTIAIPEGQSQASFYYRDSAVGSSVITTAGPAPVAADELPVTIQHFDIQGEPTIRTQNAFQQLHTSPWLFAHTSSGAVTGNATITLNAQADGAVTVDWQLTLRQNGTEIAMHTANGASTTFTTPTLTTNAGASDYELEIVATDEFDNQVTETRAIEISPWTVEVEAAESSIANNTPIHFSGQATATNTSSDAQTALVQLFNTQNQAVSSASQVAIESDGSFAGTISTDLLHAGADYRLRVILANSSSQTLAESLSATLVATDDDDHGGEPPTPPTPPEPPVEPETPTAPTDDGIKGGEAGGTTAPGSDDEGEAETPFTPTEPSDEQPDDAADREASESQERYNWAQSVGNWFEAWWSWLLIALATLTGLLLTWYIIRRRRDDGAEA